MTRETVPLVGGTGGEYLRTRGGPGLDPTGKDPGLTCGEPDFGPLLAKRHPPAGTNKGASLRRGKKAAA